ncbi:MAG: tRNA A-37 threonylcarbamoyl transferase component Bud32 [Gammaproteobacteria bacterium]|jgi:tRNA A-37 threonylcarbamoyl transferase component Bud32
MKRKNEHERATILSRSSTERGSEDHTVLSTQRGHRAVVDTSVIEALLAGVVMPADERIELAGRIAESGMSTIDEVIDHALRRRIARKTIQSERQQDTDITRLFLREAQITSQLDHPNIVPVHDLGVDHEGRVFFTLKLVRGRTLGTLIDELPEGSIDFEQLLNLLDVVVKVCEALAFAHSRGVIHCDIKPSNIMVGEFGETYLMDWGVAQFLPDDEDIERLDTLPQIADAPSETSYHTFIGTPAYMSPEQASGQLELLGAHTDVFGVGALLYEILARRPPYAQMSGKLAIEAARVCGFAPLSEFSSSAPIPSGLERIVAKAMAAKPPARYDTIDALRRDLVQFLRGGSVFPIVQFMKGDTIVREGDTGDCAYIIQSGECGVYRSTADEQRLVNSLGAGEIFGETAILSPGPRTASVVALGEVTAQVITAQVLTREVDAMQPWMGMLIRAVADRFRKMAESD